MFLGYYCAWTSIKIDNGASLIYYLYKYGDFEKDAPVPRAERRDFFWQAAVLRAAPQWF